MKTKIKLAAMALGIGLSMGTSFSSSAFSCSDMCLWAQIVCDVEPQSEECAISRIDCARCV